MTKNYDRLLEIQNKKPDLTVEGLSPAYMKVLNFLWNGQFASASDTASTVLAENPDQTDSAKMYRAWIEALSQLEDFDSLKSLGEHLFERGKEEPQDALTYAALRGIVHIELDQAPMARLICRAITGKVNNPYCLEFEQLCSRRGFDEAKFSIVDCKSNIDDYFVWNTLVQDLALASENSAAFASLQNCMSHISKAFPGSPAKDLVNMHHAFDHGIWHVVSECAARLHHNFPNQRDFLFFGALASFNAKDLNAAISKIETLDIEQRSSDVDFMNLYGECLAERFFKNDDENDAHLAIELLNKSSKMMRRFGLPIDKTLSIIQSLEDQVGGISVPKHSTNMFRAPRSWMVVLSPRRTEELVNSSDEHVQTLHRPLGAEAEPGDVVLFASRASHTAKKATATRQEWRILAMYRVVSRPYWHAVHRWHSTLELIDRPEHPIPIDTQELKSDIDVRGKRSKLSRGHHARFGVYSLDDGAMDIMIAAVKRRSEGVDHEQERRGVNLSKQKPV